MRLSDVGGFAVEVNLLSCCRAGLNPLGGQRQQPYRETVAESTRQAVPFCKDPRRVNAGTF